MQKFDVCIIGAGAGGLFLASKIENKSVLVLEKSEKVGKKILASGNGRCNLSNTNISEKFYTGDNIESFLCLEESKKVVPYFESLGLEVHSDEEGRIYPKSNLATSVLDVLRLKIEHKQNVHIKVQEEVLSICQNKGGYIVKTNNSEYFANNVVIATGGGVYLQKNFNLETEKFEPALCSLKTEKNKGLLGVRVSPIKATLKHGKSEFSEVGEVLFKESAISGICIFNLSLYYKQYKPAEIVLDLLPNISLQSLKNNLKARRNKFIDYTLNEFFTGLFHKNLAQNILEKSELSGKLKIEKLTQKDFEKLAHTIKNYTLKVVGKESNNQIHSGGVKLNSLTQNLESKNHKGLFVLGENLNVQGICGGFNLHWAFLTANIIAKEINKL